MFSSAVSVGHQVEGLEDEPDAVAAQHGELLVVERGEVGVADEHLAGRERVEPGQAVHQRRLARARRAHDGGEAPRSNSTVTPSRARTSRVAAAVDLDGVDGRAAAAARRWAGCVALSDGHAVLPATDACRMRADPYAIRPAARNVRDPREPVVAAESDAPYAVPHDLPGVWRRGSRRVAVLLVLRPALLASCGDERRVVTVLFADLVGFTTLSETLDPEQVKNLVDRVLRAAGRRHHRVRRPGRQDHRRRHRRPVRRAGRPRGRRRAGRAGRAADAGDAGRPTAPRPSARGPHAHRRQHRRGAGRRAAGRRRLHGDGRRGEHRAAAADRGRARARCWSARPPTPPPRRSSPTSRVGPVEAKGRDEPVEAWVAIEPLLPPGSPARAACRRAARRARRPSSACSATPSTPAVDAARAAPASCCRRGRRGQVPPGRGARRPGRACEHGAIVLEGRCVPYGEANVWWPVAEALRQACGVAPDAPARRRPSAAAADAVGRALRPPDRRRRGARVANGLLYLMGYEAPLREIDPAAGPRGGDRAVAHASSRASARAPARSSSCCPTCTGPTRSCSTCIDDLTRAAQPPAVRARRHRPPVAASSAGRRRPAATTPWSSTSTRSTGATGELLDALARPTDRRRRPARRAARPQRRQPVLPRGARRAPRPTATRRRPGDSRRRPRRIGELPDTLRGPRGGPPRRPAPTSGHARGRRGARAAAARSRRWRRWPRHIARATDIDAVLDGLADEGDPRRRRRPLVVPLRPHPRGRLRHAHQARPGRRHCGIANCIEHRQRRSPADVLVDALAHHYGAAAELVDRAGRGRPGLGRGDPCRRARRGSTRPRERAEEAGSCPVGRAAVHARRCGWPAPSASTRPPRPPARPGARRAPSCASSTAARADVDEADGGRRAAVDDRMAGRGRCWRAARSSRRRATLDAALAHARRRGRPLRGARRRRRARPRRLRSSGMAQLFRGDSTRPSARSLDARSTAFRELGDRRGEAWALQNLAWIALHRRAGPTRPKGRCTTSAATFAEIGDAGGLAGRSVCWPSCASSRVDTDEAERVGRADARRGPAAGDRWAEGMMLSCSARSAVDRPRRRGGRLRPRRPLALFQRIGDRFGQAQAGSLGRALVMSGGSTRASRAEQTPATPRGASSRPEGPSVTPRRWPSPARAPGQAGDAGADRARPLADRRRGVGHGRRRLDERGRRRRWPCSSTARSTSRSRVLRDAIDRAGESRTVRPRHARWPLAPGAPRASRRGGAAGARRWSAPTSAPTSTASWPPLAARAGRGPRRRRRDGRAAAALDRPPRRRRHRRPGAPRRSSAWPRRRALDASRLLRRDRRCRRRAGAARSRLEAEAGRRVQPWSTVGRGAAVDPTPSPPGRPA